LASPVGTVVSDFSTGALRPDTLDRLDYFIAELKKQGIYVNLCLKAGGGFPGTPAGWTYNGKGLDLFYPPFVATVKQYIRNLLTHLNPYTGTTYAQEPAIASLDVQNEDSFGMFTPAQMAGLPEPFASELRKQWVAWLQAKYGTTDGLRAA